jgi:hypothetical protein
MQLLNFSQEWVEPVIDFIAKLTIFLLPGLVIIWLYRVWTEILKDTFRNFLLYCVRLFVQYNLL